VAPTFPFTALEPVEVFAAEDSSAQIVWRSLPDGEIGAVVDGREFRLGSAGRAGAADVTGLRPDAAVDIDITIDGRMISRHTIRTEPSLVHPELFRIATISDLHLGQNGFGLVKQMRERPRPHDGYPLRCARAAVRDAVEWGAQLLVIKGDITELGEPAHWDLVDEFLAEVPIPVMAIPGNHDTVGERRSLDATVELRRRGLFPSPVQVHDVPGARIIAADSTVPGHSWGRIRHHADELQGAADVLNPVLLFVHHHFEQRRHPSVWPLGAPQRDSLPTLDAMLAVNPNLLVSSGHTHRNRVRRYQSSVITEVGSTKDHPGVWAGYVIHADGIRQVVRRVTDPNCIEWTERTHAAVGGIWGKWSPGRLSDRSLTHRWSGELPWKDGDPSGRVWSRGSARSPDSTRSRSAPVR